MSINGFSKPLMSVALASFCALTSLESAAVGQCKGLEEPNCKDHPDCTWVSSYTTKNGASISAYCRSASGKGKIELDIKEGKGRKSGANDRDKAPTAKSATINEENRG